MKWSTGTGLCLWGQEITLSSNERNTCWHRKQCAAMHRNLYWRRISTARCFSWLLANETSLGVFLFWGLVSSFFTSLSISYLVSFFTSRFLFLFLYQPVHLLPCFFTSLFVCYLVSLLACSCVFSIKKTTTTTRFLRYGDITGQYLSLIHIWRCRRGP